MGEIGNVNDLINAENVSNEELQEAFAEQNVYFEVTDEDGVTHKLLLLSLFEAGALKRKYVAGLTADIVVYQYVPHMEKSGDYKHIIKEIGSDEELTDVCTMFDKYVDMGISQEDVREMSLIMEIPDDEGGTAELPIVCNVYKIFELPKYNRQYVVCCPTNIMFFRYDEFEKDGQNFVEFSTIYSPQEYEDVSDEFNRFLVNDDTAETGEDNAENT